LSRFINKDARGRAGALCGRMLAFGGAFVGTCIAPFLVMDPAHSNLVLNQNCEHAIIVLDTKGIIVGWYCGAELVFGYTAAEAIGKPSSILFVSEDVQKGMPSYEMAVAAHDRDAEDDRWMLRKDGMRIWVTGSLGPLKDENGQLIGFGKILRNRTDLKSRLEWLEKHLETHELVIQRKNNFISTLAHEIRNPLGAISTALALLNRIGSPDPDGAFARATISRQVEFLSRLVNDLLEVTLAPFCSTVDDTILRDRVNLHRTWETCWLRTGFLESSPVRAGIARLFDNLAAVVQWRMIKRKVHHRIRARSTSTKITKWNTGRRTSAAHRKN
jgi:PAS domain S-box-containing protein